MHRVTGVQTGHYLIEQHFTLVKVVQLRERRDGLRLNDSAIAPFLANGYVAEQWPVKASCPTKSIGNSHHGLARAEWTNIGSDAHEKPLPLIHPRISTSILTMVAPMMRLTRIWTR